MFPSTQSDTSPYSVKIKQAKKIFNQRECSPLIESELDFIKFQVRKIDNVHAQISVFGPRMSYTVPLETMGPFARGKTSSLPIIIAANSPRWDE